MNIVAILGVMALVAVGIFVLRWTQAPRAGTERLAMVVWATFKPYETAENAEKNLRRAAGIVFGEGRVREHEPWIQGHTNNFLEWEREGCLKPFLEAMCKGLLTNAYYGVAYRDAYRSMQESLVEQVKEGADWMNREFLEKGGHKIETVQQSDGSVGWRYTQIWSDEEIEKKREDSEAIITAVGRNISSDQSSEARQLLTFLRLVYRANADKEFESEMELGRTWFACLHLNEQNPDSELAQEFRRLNDAWSATRPS